MAGVGRLGREGRGNHGPAERSTSAGRGLRHALPPGAAPDFALHLLSHRPKPVPWPSHWLRWPDFRLPADDREAREAIADLWTRAERQRVEIACGGGRGRTRTVLACLAVLDGVPPRAAVAYVRRHYGERAVETPSQRRYVERFDSAS